MHDRTPIPRPRPSAAARVAALVTAAVLALVALAMLAGGAAVFWVDGHKDGQGYLTTDDERFTTTSRALVSEDLEVDADVPGWLLDADRYGEARLRVTPRGDRPVFVGIARTQDVEAYLRRTARTTVRDLDFDPFRVEYATRGSGPAPTPPSEQPFWTASAQGADTQTVAWDVEPGEWSVVVMNADGSRGVDARVSAGAKVPILTAIGWGAIGGGALLLVAAGGLLHAGSRRTTPHTLPPAPVAAAV